MNIYVMYIQCTYIYILMSESYSLFSWNLNLTGNPVFYLEALLLSHFQFPRELEVNVKISMCY